MKNKHWLEAGASFFIVGLGQIIKGEGKKGLIFILIFYFVLPTATYLSLMVNAYFFLLVFSFSLIFGIIFWLYNIWDALKHETVI
ncbi:MAG: hypothetical protein ACPL4K_01485 [Candidatus Margulisiibacteriota bacterium]